MSPLRARADFAAALDAARRARHLSIRQVARIAGVPPATAQGWLSGRHFPTPALRPQYLVLAAELGLADQVPDELFADRSTPMPDQLRSGKAPYLGLKPFDVADAPLFFGRDADSRQLAQRLATLRASQGGGVVALVGPSGRGKSSLLAAGLVATQCVTGLLAGWRTAAVPVADLAAVDGDELDLVVVDQFEDALRLPQCDEILAALEALAGRLVVVIGLRSDAFAEASQQPILVEPLSAPVLLAPISRDQLREVVVGPAQRAGVTVDEELVRVLLDDLTDGQRENYSVLPLLSTALLATWAAGSGDRMTVADYYAAGGVSQAVQSLAEQVYHSLTTQQQDAAEQLFLRLVAVTAEAVVREPLPRHTIDATTQPVLDAFVAARMLTVADEVVQISHDALLTHWQRLRDWIADRRDDLVVLARVRRAAAIWEETGRDPGALVPVTRLESVAQWLAEPAHHLLLTGSEQEFIEASESHFASALEAERRANATLRRQRRRALILTAATTAFAVVAGVALWGMRDSQLAAELARSQAQSRQVATVARSLRAKDPNLQGQMAVVAAGLADTMEGRSVLLEATASDAPLQWHGDRLGVLAAQDDLVVRGTGAGKATLWRSDELTTSPGYTWQVDPSGAALHAVALVTVEGRQLLAAGGTSVRSVWDVTDEPRLIAELPAIEATTYAAAFDPSGRVLFGAGDGSVEVWQLGDTSRPSATFLLDETTRGDRTMRPAVSSIAVSPGGIAHVGGAESGIARWRLADAERLPDLPTQFDSVVGTTDVRVLALAISPDGRRLAAGLGAAGVLRWDLAGEDATVTEPLRAFTSYVNGVSFSPDSRQLITASSDQDVVVFDTETGAELRRLTTPTIAHQAAIVADRPIATGADGMLRVWAPGSPVWRSSGSTIYNMSGSEQWLAGGSPADGIALWRLGSGVPQRMSTPVVGELPDGDIQQGAAMLAPNQAWLAGGTRDGRILTWPLTPAGASKVSVFDAGIGYIAAVAVSPDSRLLAAFGYLGTRTAIFTAGPAGQLTRVALIDTPDAQLTTFVHDDLLAVALASNRVALWGLADPANPVAIGEIELPSMPQTVAAHPSGGLLAVGEQSGAVSLWSLADPANPVRQRGYGDPRSGMYSLEFSPDGRMLIGTSGDDQIWGWDLTSDETTALFSLNGELGRPWDARFIDGGTRFAVSGSTGAVKVWLADTVAAREWLCTNRGDRLTDEDWERYLPGIEPKDPC